MACDKKGAPVCLNLAVIYIKYAAVPLDIEKNEKKALEYEQKAEQYRKQ